MKKILAFVTLAALASVFAGCSAGGGAMIPAAPVSQLQQANSADTLGGGPPTPQHADTLGGGPPTPHRGETIGGGPPTGRRGR